MDQTAPTPFFFFIGLFAIVIYEKKINFHHGNFSDGEHNNYPTNYILFSCPQHLMLSTLVGIKDKYNY